MLACFLRIVHSRASLSQDAGSVVAPDPTSTPPDIRSSNNGQDTLLDRIYGKRPALRPIHDVLMQQVARFQPDLRVDFKKSYVCLYRSHLFARLQPTGKTCLDLMLQLRGFEASGRLEDARGVKPLMTHRIRLRDPIDVDNEVYDWLRQAWALS